VTEDGSVVGRLAGAAFFAENARIQRLGDLEYLVIGQEVFDVASRRAVEKKQESGGGFRDLARSVRRLLSPFNVVLFSWVVWLFASLLSPVPVSPPGFFYYSETSSTIVRRAPDGTLDTQTKRDVQSNIPFRISDARSLRDNPFYY